MALSKSIWFWLRRKLNLGWLLLSIHPKSIVVLEGWNQSFRTNQSIDREGRPLPWYTYSSIHFIETKLNKTLRVFEYGCGNSTRYYAPRVAEIVSVENDKEWAQQISRALPPNAKVIFQDSERQYIDEVTKHGRFDIIVIDGLFDRVACTHAAIDVLTDQGIVIVDNSNWPEFMECVHFLTSRGFRELPFYGQTPITFVPSQTSILYRQENCFGI